jgi:hypothetical protein
MSAMLASVVAVLLAPVQAEERKPAPGPWKAEFQLTLAEKDGDYAFSVAGTTTIAPDVILRARVYALEIVDDFRRGKREDEEPLVWEDDEAQPSHRRFQAEGGKFQETVYRFVRRPWAIRYRARVHYVPRDQTQEVLKRMGDDELSWHADLRYGTEKDFAEQMRERVKEVSEDLTAIEQLYSELRKKYDEHRKTKDADAWKLWKAPWYDKVERLSERNKFRYNLWAVWMERQARMRIGGMGELLRRILVLCSEQILDGKDQEERIAQMFDGFFAYFEEAVEVIGIEAPLDIQKVGPLVAAYEAGVAPLRAWVEKGAGEDGEALRRARREAYTALLKLPALLVNRKRGYAHVNETSARLSRLLALAEEKAPADELRKALAEHDAAFAEFRRFAGLLPASRQ